MGDHLKQWIKAVAAVIGIFVVIMAILSSMYNLCKPLWIVVIILIYVICIVDFTRQLHNGFTGEVYTTVTAKDLMRHFLFELGANEDTYNKEEKENLSRLIIELNRYNQLHDNPAERIKLVYKAGEK